MGLMVDPLPYFYGGEKMEKIIQAEKLVVWIESKICEVEFKADGRKEIVAGLLDLSLEYHKSIILLFSEGYNGAAFSLLRVLFEAWVRSLWLMHCASKNEVEKYTNNQKIEKNMAQLIKDIEKVPGYTKGVISKAKKAGWWMMNDFTHSGYEQVRRRFSPPQITPNYDLHEIEEKIDFANAVGLGCFWEISFLSENSSLIEAVSTKIKEVS